MDLLESLELTRFKPTFVGVTGADLANINNLETMKKYIDKNIFARTFLAKVEEYKIEGVPLQYLQHDIEVSICCHTVSHGK